MQYFVSLFPLDRWRSFDELVGVLQVAERLGFARVGLAEHVITPLGLDAPERPSRFWPDNFTFASALARETTRVRFLLSALVVPYRRPLHAAKSIATLDWLSAGRVDVTAGVGWMREEFDALGIPMRERGARTTEYLRAMIELWTSDTPSFDGRYLRFGGLVFEPKCVQRPHVPLLIGGTGERAFAQVLEFGAGWAAMNVSAEEVRAGRRRIGQLCAETRLAWPRLHPRRGGRRYAAIRHDDRTADAPVREEPVPELVACYTEAGVTDLGLSFPWRDAEEYADRLRWFADALM